jgi:glycosyltransferase involved in cell wall biosynthesis
VNPDLTPPRSIEPLTATGRLTRLDAVSSNEGDVYHVGSAFENVGIDRVWPPYARRGRMSLVITVYDLIPEVFPELYLQEALVRRRYRARLELIRHADRVLAISRATKADIVKRLGIPAARVTVAGGGVGDRFHRPESWEAAHATARQAVSELEAEYILYTGGIEPRKNVGRLLEAYAALPEDHRAAHQLVIVCRVVPEERARLDSELARLGISDRVLFPGYVADPELVALYQACHLFVFPSLYEGFGLPVAEAAACGAPVLVSGTSSLVELVPDEAQFDPHDVKSITAALKRALVDESFRVRLRQEDLPSWRDVAARTAEAYEDVDRRSRTRRGRPRVAFVSPLPPQPSGVADASYRLLEALAERCDVDAFADGCDVGESLEAKAPAGVKVASARSFDRCERARGGYDRVVYCLGNSEFHGEALALLRKRPGIVVAHDLRLSGLYTWATRERPEVVPSSFYETLQSMYGDRIPSWLGEEGWLDLEDADRYGVFMARDVLASCERFLVHSSYAAQLARLEAAPADASKIDVVPFGMVNPDDLPRGATDGSALIATFGIATAAKQTQKIVEAFGVVAKTNPEASFAVVGSFPDPRERAAAEERVKKLGIGGRIELPGRLDEATFYEWTSRTTVAVQLRSWSNGETSAAVADCLAAGIPTIVTAIGSAAELPDDCVVKVALDITPERLGREIEALLADPPRRARLTEAGIAFAREHSFEHAAEALYEKLMH